MPARTIQKILRTVNNMSAKMTTNNDMHVIIFKHCLDLGRA